ncbi:MAG TPA: hypothetical protein VJ553_02715 [Candidatus Paceibacterota bacterium]|nr:hypothetical protein [Candidatus Paceibacterota bacterium]
MAAATALRATLSAHVDGEQITAEVSADLWDRFRVLRRALGLSETDMIRWLTEDGRIELSEHQVELFVDALERGLPYL